MYSQGGGKGRGGAKSYDHLIKLIIIGDSHVGKSCILLRFSDGEIPLTHMPTIGKQIESFNIIFRHRFQDQDCQY